MAHETYHVPPPRFSTGVARFIFRSFPGYHGERPSRWLCSLFLAVCLFSIGHAQIIPTPQFRTIYPAGGQVGTVVDVEITTTQNDDIEHLLFSHPGITATPLTESLQPLLDKTFTKSGRFKVSIRQNVKPGIYDVRAQSRYGISNPRRFMVSTHPEILGKPGSHVANAQPLPLHTVINGRTASSQIAYFTFPAKKAHALTIDAYAERIDSKADLTLKIMTRDGLPLQEYRDTKYRDPIAVFEPPADGDYILGVYDFTYGGGAEHVYRFRVSDQPFVTDVFPPAIEPGTKQEITFTGVHLPSNMQKIEVHAPENPSSADRPYQLSDPIFQFTHPGTGQILPISLATAPVIKKQGDEQVLAIPGEIAGHFGHEETFLIDTKKDQSLYIEVFSHRMGHASDPYLVVEKVQTNDQAKTTYTFVTEQDDTNSKIGGPRHKTSHRDPAYSLKPNADTRYRIKIGDRFGTSAPYRLAVRSAKPDFSLFALSEMPGMDQKKGEPWHPVLLNKGAVPVEVSVIRRDGFNAPISVKFEGLPESISHRPAIISPSANSTTVLLRAGGEAWSGPVHIVGTAKDGERELKRKAAISSTIWSIDNLANRYHRARLTTHNVLAVVQEPTAPASLTAAGKTSWESCLGAKFDLPLKLTRHADLKGDITVNCLAFPGYAKLPNAKIAKDKDEGVFKFDFNKNSNKALKPGTYEVTFTTTSTFKWKPDPARKEMAEKDKAEIEAAYKKQEALLKQRGAERQAAQKFIQTEKERATKESLTEDAAQKVVAEAEQKFKAAELAEKEAKTLLDKGKSWLNTANARVKSTSDRLKERDLKYTGYSEPITIKLAAAPVTVHPSSDKIEAAPASKTEYRVRADRKYGFADTIAFTITPPKDLKGIKVTQASLPKDQAETTLAIEIAEDAPAGSHTMELKTTYKFNNQNFEDKQTLMLEVKAPNPPPAPEAEPNPAPDKENNKPAENAS